ncbi:hypothetical protein F8M41_002013 [Gigaspora margarita]|uniref:Uncharacterized protein n=1 Tax=Gigaspora margarita TaxID=4874 RepID=A0A8H4AYT7_GIGMA|nr:hypothetical protein F8M41_002013 [Gigaspora margarita]
MPQITYPVNPSITISTQGQPQVMHTSGPALSTANVPVEEAVIVKNEIDNNNYLRPTPTERRQERTSYSENKIIATTPQSKIDDNEGEESDEKKIKPVGSLLEADLDDKAQKKVSIINERIKGTKILRMMSIKLKKENPRLFALRVSTIIGSVIKN